IPSRSFERDAAPAPKLVAPADGVAVNYPTPVVFQWQPVPGAVDYTLSYQREGATTWTDVPKITTTSYAPTAKLDTGSWQWRVRATFKRSGTSSVTYSGPSSPVWTVPTAWPTSLSQPQLLAPDDASTHNDVTLTWKPVAGAQKYLVELSQD